MTIYDVPVSDTKFFPVSGDMMRQMKHEEERRAKAEEERRDQIIRDQLAHHRAEHLIALLHKQNDTGTLAKESPDVVNSNPLKGEQAMLHVSVSHDDLAVHPVWCDPERCTAPDYPELGDRRLHERNLGYIEVDEREGVDVTLVKFDDEDPEMIVGDSCLNLQQLENLILLLDAARLRLIEATSTGYTLTSTGRAALERED